VLATLFFYQNKTAACRTVAHNPHPIGMATNSQNPASKSRLAGRIAVTAAGDAI